LPRILVNLAMESDAAARARLLTMARKLYRFMSPLSGLPLA
jgi:protoporphyrinogen IX oxidase